MNPTLVLELALTQTPMIPKMKNDYERCRISRPTYAKEARSKDKNK